MEAVFESVSVSTWFPDDLTAEVLGLSAALPLPAAESAGPAAVAALLEHIEGLGGLRTLEELLRQRYRPVYGPPQPAVLEEWRRRCGPVALAAQREAMGEDQLRPLRAGAAAKRASFAGLAAAGSQAEHIKALMVADEVELTLGLVLGDASIYGFLAGCVGAGSGDGVG